MFNSPILGYNSKEESFISFKPIEIVMMLIILTLRRIMHQLQL